MKAKILMATFFILMSLNLTGCSTSAEESLEVAPVQPSFETLTTESLAEDPYVFFIYLNDNESSWDTSSMKQFWTNEVEPELSSLRKEAESEGLTLDLTAGTYYTPLKYDGAVIGDSTNTTVSYDVLDQTALSLGYSSKEAMHEALQNHTGNPEITYVVLLNKAGSSYTLSTTSEETSILEHRVVFSTQL